MADSVTTLVILVASLLGAAALVGVIVKIHERRQRKSYDEHLPRHAVPSSGRRAPRTQPGTRADFIGKSGPFAGPVPAASTPKRDPRKMNAAQALYIQSHYPKQNGALPTLAAASMVSAKLPLQHPKKAAAPPRPPRRVDAAFMV
jgi:hypothetical protein